MQYALSGEWEADGNSDRLGQNPLPAWMLRLCWPPARGLLEPEERVCKRAGSRGGDAYFGVLHVVCK